MMFDGKFKYLADNGLTNEIVKTLDIFIINYNTKNMLQVKKSNGKKLIIINLICNNTSIVFFLLYYQVQL